MRMNSPLACSVLAIGEIASRHDMRADAHLRGPDVRHESPILRGAGSVPRQPRHRRRTMRTRRVVVFALIVLTAAGPLVAETAGKYAARLDWVPIGGAERGDVSGMGSVTATLTGSRLVINGTFESLPARATAAKLQQGTATGARGRGPVVGEL